VNLEVPRRLERGREIVSAESTLRNVGGGVGSRIYSELILQVRMTKPLDGTLLRGRDSYRCQFFDQVVWKLRMSSS
jgi:hypothetical protein